MASSTSDWLAPRSSACSRAWSFLLSGGLLRERVSFVMPTTREQILARLRQSKSALQKEFPLRRLALFGSYAHGTQIAGRSDIDLLVEVEPSIGLRFVALAERLEQLLGEPVDLVSRRAVKPSLWKKIEPELIDA